MPPILTAASVALRAAVEYGHLPMAQLHTPQEVITATGVGHLARYEDVGPLADTVGFFAFRRYPAGSRLAQMVTSTGAQDARCLVQLSLRHPIDPLVLCASTRSW